MADLPDELKKCLNQIDVIVYEIAEKSDLLGTTVEKELDLLSLYEVVPISDAYHDERDLRGQLTLFKRAVEKICEEESELIPQLTSILEEELSYRPTL